MPVHYVCGGSACFTTSAEAAKRPDLACDDDVIITPVRYHTDPEFAFRIFSDAISQSTIFVLCAVTPLAYYYSSTGVSIVSLIFLE